MLVQAETKAIAKILSDFKHIKEVDFSNCNLTAVTAQDIADGLMRAKSIEILRVNDNASIGKGLTSIIYNLAFSPKIRIIEMANCKVVDAQIAEAIYKLIKISGAVESLNMEKVDCWQNFTEDFFISLGESKTLKYLNMNSSVRVTANTKRLGKALAMNAKKNGSIEHVSM
jgi:Ran GTPase-activating protein (RanGAP) involved in mRNA processing and transport